MTTEHSLKIMLLGGFDVRLNDRPVAGFTYNKMRALLAYLALESEQDHNREFLAELLWSGNDSTVARDNLRRALSSLRRVLELPTDTIMFSATKHTIRFIPNVYVDSKVFLGQIPASPVSCGAAQTHEEKIIGLYRGELLTGLFLPDSPDFEDWLQTKREALHRRALALLEQLSNHYLQRGNYSKALQFTLRHTELEPWDEDAHRRAMHLYALNNQNGAAIRQYEICCRLLKKELGVLPDEETRHLAECIRNSTSQWWSTDTTVEAPPLLQIISSSFAGRRNKERRRDDQRRAAREEQRQVSVLYCELTVVAIDDLDETMTLLYMPQSRCLEIIRQFSGHIVQTHGGGILAYFGYPQAHEYAARYAVQAALEISRETSRIIRIRVSVHTGLIIAGSNPFMPDTVGKTSKIAIKLNHTSKYDGVIISQPTQRIVSGFFNCISLGVQFFSGLSGYLEIFKVLQKSSSPPTRLDTAAQLTPLVGRKAEIAELMALWEKAEHGVRHVVLVQGEAGIGKSRLLHAIKERLADRPHAIRELRCFLEFSQSPFHPLIAMFEAVMGFTYYDTPEVKCAKVVAYVETHYPESKQDTVPMLTRLLSLPLDGHYQASGFSPQKQKEQTIATLFTELQTLAVMQPVLLIVEDLHWIDPSTLELLTLLVEQKGKGAILTVFTARPGFIPPWKEALTSTLTLGPLTDSETVEIIASLNKDISATTIRSILERTDGTPLFTEELAKIAIRDDQAGIPATLHDLLTMRLDNMREAKYTAQLAAAIGREFNVNLLRMISPHDPVRFTRALSALQDAGLILKADEITYQFKHALIQEAAYQFQTTADRQATHQRIAQALQSDFPDVAATQPELLAQHLSYGGKTPQSIEYWIKAGQQAARNSANLEAIEHYNRGLRLLMTLPPEQDRNKTEFNILVSLCSVYYAARGYGSEEASQVNVRLSALSRLVGDSRELFQSEWMRVVNTIASVGSRGMPEAAMRLLNMAHDEPLKKLAAHYLAVKAFFWLGEFESAQAHNEQVIALYNPNQRRMMLEQFGTDLSVFSAAYSINALYFLGFPDRAQMLCGKMLEQARQSAHPHTLAQALSGAAVLHRWLNKPAEALSLSAEAIAISRQHDFSLWLVCSEMTHGWALVMQGQNEAGIAELQSSIAGMRAATGGMSVFFLSALIEAYVHMKRYDKALSLLAEAQADVANTGDGHFTAELHRLKGVCLLETFGPDTKEAEACFNQAIAISRKQGSKSLELRAAISMARLWQQQDRQEDAQCMLEEIYSWFTEDFDTPDLQEA